MIYSFSLISNTQLDECFAKITKLDTKMDKGVSCRVVKTTFTLLFLNLMLFYFIFLKCNFYLVGNAIELFNLNIIFFNFRPLIFLLFTIIPFPSLPHPYVRGSVRMCKLQSNTLFTIFILILCENSITISKLVLHKVVRCS
jgi:hypothetical protein